MNPLEAVPPVVVLAFVFHRIVQSQLDKLADPPCLRREGVVVVAEEILQAHSAPIGRYMGRKIWGSVTFIGMKYCYDHVLQHTRKERLAPGKPYLEPGLVFSTD